MRVVLLSATPFLLVALCGLFLGAAIADAHAVGVIALACAPSFLQGPALLGRLGRGKREAAASLVAGSLALAVLTILIASPAALVPAAPLGTAATWAFVGGAAVASSLPPLRDLLLWPLARTGELATAALAAIVAIRAGSALDPFSFVLALSLLGIGAGAAWLLAIVLGRDPLASIVGSGTRDAPVAGAVALAAGGPVAATVPLAYGLLALGAVSLVAAREGYRRRLTSRAE